MGKIRFTGMKPAISQEAMARNAEHAKRRGLPPVRGAPARAGSALAIVGGGPSINAHLPALRQWPGEIWAVNGAWLWARDNGLDATFFTLCGALGWETIFKEPVPAGSRAIIATTCEPYLFDRWALGEVRTVDAVDDGILTGTTTVTGGWMLGPKLGFSHTVFFGCESSFPDQVKHGHSHSGVQLEQDDALVIRAGGRDYRTCPEFLVQAEMMAEIIRRFPAIYSERSGGLLSALIANPDYDLVAASRRIAETLVPEVRA